MAVTGEFAKAHPDVIEKITEAQKTIAKSLQDDPEAAYALTAKALDLSEDAVREMAAAYDFSLEITEEDIAGFQKTADFMAATGMIDEPYDVRALFF